MKRFVEAPNLPRRAGSVIIGEKYRAALETPLMERGIKPLILPDNPDIDARLSSHADLSALHGGGERLFLAPYLRGSLFCDELKKLGMDIVFAEMEQAPSYPHDVQLNCCVAGNHALYRRGFIPKEIDYFLTKSKKYTHVDCKQGYARCAVCIVGEGSIITADAGIARAAEAHGMEVLKIENGFFRLPGFAYGFIGGASFKLSDRELAFTGQISGHPNENEMIAFIRRHGVTPVFLTALPAFDMGSAIPIMEEENIA